MSFADLFELENNTLKAKIAITIEDNEYEAGDVITETNLQNFDLMDNPKVHDYILTRLNNGVFLNGRARKN